MITYSPSFVEFIENSSCRIAKMLYKGYISNHPSYRLMLNNTDVNYITIQANGNIGFLPSGKQLLLTPTGDWSNKGRQHGKPSKIIRKLFTDKAMKLLSEVDFEDFSNAYKAKFCKGLRFELLPNEAIPSVYDMPVAHGESSLANSCMNGMSSYMDIYKHCQSLKILVLKNRKNELCGRSLIWEIEGITIMDRIYVSEDYMYECFIHHATERGWWYKKNYKSRRGKTLFINEKGEEVHKYLIINTDTDFDDFPFIDTFTYGNDTSLNNYWSGCYKYTSSGGYRLDIDADDDEE